MYKGITGQKNFQEYDRQNLYFGCPNQRGCDGRGMLNIWGNENIHKICGWITRRVDPGVDRNIKLKQILIERDSVITTLFRVGFTVDKAALGQVFLRAFRCSPVGCIPQTLLTLINSYNRLYIHSLTLKSVLRQVHSLIQGQLSTECQLVLLLSTSSILSFP